MTKAEFMGAGINLNIEEQSGLQFQSHSNFYRAVNEKPPHSKPAVGNPVIGRPSLGISLSQSTAINIDLDYIAELAAQHNIPDQIEVRLSGLDSAATDQPDVRKPSPVVITIPSTPTPRQSSPANRFCSETELEMLI